MSKPNKIPKSVSRAERRGASPVARRSSIASAESIPGRKIRILGVPLDLGQSRRGVDMGPSAVRVAGLQARLEALGHQVRGRRQYLRRDCRDTKHGRPRCEISARDY